MNGPQCVREAEKCLNWAEEDSTPGDAAYYNAHAQVFATLAVAAAVERIADLLKDASEDRPT